jgi:hypothetical protein
LEFQNNATSEKGGATVNSNSEICFIFCRKYHKMEEGFARFPTIYNMLQISTQPHCKSLHNVVIRFSQLHFFFLFSDRYGTFSQPIF